MQNLDIKIGQTYRRLTHVRRFYSALKSPMAVQEKKLKEIIAANKDTAFGIDHHFAAINNYSDYVARVPARDYEYFRPYVDRLAAGEKNQLTREDPFMFATTSGTTAKPKYVPITPGHLKDYTHAFQIHNYHLVQSFENAARGRFLVIVSNDEEGRTEAGLPYGAVSGLLNRRQPSIIKRHFACPYELCKIKDVNQKYYLMLRAAIGQDVTAVLGCNPSSLLLLADQLNEHSQELIRDLHDGSVNPDYSPPSIYSEAFSPFFKKQPEVARRLSQILEQEGRLTPSLIWPQLQVLSCWKGGPMSFYLDRLPEYYGDIPVRDFGYMASEGRGSIPITDQGAGGILALTSHFFEFVEESDMESDNPRFMTLDGLRQGGRYYIFFSTAGGLYRYNINDLVEVSGFVENTPVIQFVRKGLGVSSITGEKVTEEQVLVALRQAVKQLSLEEISHFTAEVELGYPPFYVCYSELSSALPESIRIQFVRIFDQSLRLQNPEYEDKRSTKRLGEPVLKVLPPGTYTRLRQQRVMEGAPEAQVKIPLLSSPSSFSGRLKLLEVVAGA